MSQDLIRLMQAFFLPVAGTFHNGTWRPAFDLYRTPNGWFVKVELAGVHVEDINVFVRGRNLVIEGVRRDCGVEKGYRCYAMEVSYGRFERSFELPYDIESAQINVDYRDGMLFIRIVMEEINP